MDHSSGWCTMHPGTDQPAPGTRHPGTQAPIRFTIAVISCVRPMHTGRIPTPRGADAAFFGACLLLVVALVPGAVLRGEVLSQAQWLFDYAPWSAHRPPGTPPVNTFLVDPPTV